VLKERYVIQPPGKPIVIRDTRDDRTCSKFRAFCTEEHLFVPGILRDMMHKFMVDYKEERGIF